MAKFVRNTREPKKINPGRAYNFKKNAIAGLTLGIIRGVGMAIGFSGLAVVLLLVIQVIPLDKIPIIGDIILALINK